MADLIKLPRKQEVLKKRIRKALPNWQLTSPETMQYIKISHASKVEKDKIKERKENIAKEAIKAANKVEREKSKKSKK